MKKLTKLNSDNIAEEHICCAISDKKCKESYELKKDWLKKEFDNGYVFRRIDARAKVFIEYGPAEMSWVPIDAPNYLMVNCFWVSGQYKGQGYGKELLKTAIEDARSQGKSGLVTVVGTKKFHFMSDTKWLLKQGFVDCQRISSGFSLLVMKIDPDAETPKFKKSVLSGECFDKKGIVVYFSNRCPFAEFHAKTSLIETATKRNLPYKIIKLETMEQSQLAPSPATIFSLFFNGKFITTDISVCMDSHFDKILEKELK
ncbi:GNAT family N-acetyltransferase [Clostridium sp. CM028]|uniref:N-acetyltransferase n=1 Tax=Clostridium sp. CM028 TaxID=2851575 RepID=UPI001C6F55E6|nr:N-acetyltransferase [Clostridium sp. CM028]MBW9149737.1 GNAT family N-acetyltransferase [Clostridium sp. CM028]WLC62688.1 GNAT family N-acetyltransferase [Clostridium sp. CM028]